MCITRGGLVPAAIVARELDVRLIETISIVSYRDYKNQSTPEVVKTIEGRLLATQGQGLLVVDDLVDTGKTAKVVRELLPKAHFATVYAKPLGPARGHLHHGSFAGHLDLLPLGHGAFLCAADPG